MTDPLDELVEIARTIEELAAQIYILEQRRAVLQQQLRAAGWKPSQGAA
jgi:hypothetical protein